MPFLDDSIRAAQAAVEQKFLFRKIGLPFDYASDPEEFPSKSFATAKEARSNLPNPMGIGGGYAWTCRNHSLLFDAYLLRIETGIESPSDEQILDRLIGGLIRLDTVAPKSFLVSGLTPDGRGFYAHTNRENHAAWAFAINRGITTAAISPESQEKFRSIAGKWMDRLRREKFHLHGVDGKPVPNGDISLPDADCGPFLLGMLLVAARATGQEKDYDAYAAMAEENSRSRLAPLPAEARGESESLWRQVMLSIVARHDPEPERAELAKLRMKENAEAAAKNIGEWKRWDNSLVDAPVDLNWRSFPRKPLEESPLGFEPPESWARLDKEKHIENALSAMYTVLLTEDAETSEPLAPEMEECLSEIPWDAVVGLTALAPVVGIHARGVELNLWDKTLYDTRRESPASETSFVAKFLEPDYDDDNPDKAGHMDRPAAKRHAEGQGGKPDGQGKKKRRRRRR